MFDWLRRMLVCEFRGVCPYYREEAIYCCQGGGNWCGKYRELDRYRRKLQFRLTVRRD